MDQEMMDQDMIYYKLECWSVGVLELKSGLRIFIWALKVQFFLFQIWALLPKVPFFRCPKMALWVPKRNF